jgi:hypothetical protein
MILIYKSIDDREYAPHPSFATDGAACHGQAERCDRGIRSRDIGGRFCRGIRNRLWRRARPFRYGDVEPIGTTITRSLTWAARNTASVAAHW